VVLQPSTGRPVLDGNLNITCSVQGAQESEVSLSWSKMGEDLADNVKTEDNLIRFTGLQAGNQGLYRCQMQTADGIFYSDYDLSLMPGEGRG